MLWLVKILIVKLSAFGDIIHSLPALDDLLARDDVQQVHWLVDTRYAFVTAVFPTEVVVHTVDLKGQHRFSELKRVVCKLRAEKFDVVLDLQGLIKSALLARLICNHVVGIDQRYIREKPASWLQQSVQFLAEEKHVVQQYRKVAAGPWLHTEIETMPYSPPQIGRCFTFPASLGDVTKPILLLNLGGAWATKVLPDLIWRKIAKGGIQKGYRVVWCWGDGAEQEKAVRIRDGKWGEILPQRLDIFDLCGLLQASSFVVGADTGVLHLAAALGVPTISFWGASASWRSAPLATQDIQVESHPDCGPCFQRTCKAFICMDMIRADDILSHL